jgi:hypothetical protein
MAKPASLFAVVLFAAVLTTTGCSAPQHTGPKPSDSSSDEVVAQNDDPELGDPALNVLGKYEVEGDVLVDDDVPEEYAAVWERFAELFPAETHPEITLFVAIDKEASNGIDGALEDNELRPEERYIALDATGSDTPEELDRTMIHEFAHLFTLRDSQVSHEIADEDCDIYANHGCPLDESYLHAWEEQFWPDATDDDYSEEDDAVAERYSPDEYVTEYAATNPDEDLAEVFAEWVLSDEPATGDDVVDQKLRFFDDYPEIVQLREEIRAGL